METPAIYAGQSLRLLRLDGGIAELCFDRACESVNKFDIRTIDELKAATALIAADTSILGLLVTSAKEGFIVGADIYGITALFDRSESEIAAFIGARSMAFTALAALPLPIVTALNGVAMGGGFEIALAGDYRLMADTARLGLPEVNLGVFPAFGGCIRLPRLIGAVQALDWIATGKPQTAQAALAVAAVDACMPLAELRAAALATLRAAIADGAWKQRRQLRRGAVTRFDADLYAQLKAAAASNARHYPAALAAAEFIESTAMMSEAEALLLEPATVTRLVRTPTARALVQLFISDQIIRKKGRDYVAAARDLKQGGVLGAGIMGGGIAYASAARGIPVLMKDIAQTQLDLGKREARKLLDRQVKAGNLKAEKAEMIDASIQPTLSYAEFARNDIVIEAVVENLGVKQRVLAEVESQVGADCVLASNTSSLSIGEIASALTRPENFAGMHFFNPVPVMPLVEVIRGTRTSDSTAATVAAYAVAMGKTPVVVQDCAGFLVNRILTAYFVGFLKLIRDGADFEQVDRVMEAFGWPMGPAYLQDVIGIDTSSHVIEFISAAYPERMQLDFEHAIALMARLQRYGQKNGQGFYRYEADARGRLVKQASPEAKELVAQGQVGAGRSFSDQEIVDRLMLPMIVESAVCLEQGVAASAAEIDMSLILGLGFPRHHGGALKYADLLGVDRVVAACESYAGLGGGYRATAGMRTLATRGGRYYG